MTNSTELELQYDLLNTAFDGKKIVSLTAAAKYLGMAKTTLLTDKALPKKHIGKMVCVSLVSLAYWMTTRS